MNEKPYGKPIKVSRYETFKIDVKAQIIVHRENFPSVMSYYKRKFKAWFKV